MKVRRVSKRTYFRVLRHNPRQITNDALRCEMVFLWSCTNCLVRSAVFPDVYLLVNNRVGVTPQRCMKEPAFAGFFMPERMAYSRY